jgi:uncharacterized protein (DUF924 family)
MSEIVTPAEILEYWFGPLDEHGLTVLDKSPLWWQKNPETDAEIRARFEPTAQAAARGELHDWAETPAGCTALIVALDQFPRNMYRDTPAAFAADPLALAVSTEGIARNHDLALPLVYRVFFYLPLEHAEDRQIQAQSVGHFVQLLEQAPPPARKAAATYLDFAKRHQVIIDRFGRFPHRNQILGRRSTEEELAFLEEPGSSF